MNVSVNFPIKVSLTLFSIQKLVWSDGVFQKWWFPSWRI